MTTQTRKPNKRSPNPCLGKCGRRTERRSGYCQTCNPRPSVHALQGGQWVRRGSVLVWVEV